MTSRASPRLYYIRQTAERLPSDCQATAKRLPSDCQATAKRLPSDCQATAKRLPSDSEADRHDDDILFSIRTNHVILYKLILYELIHEACIISTFYFSTKFSSIYLLYCNSLMYCYADYVLRVSPSHTSHYDLLELCNDVWNHDQVQTVEASNSQR